jgi:ribosomal protein S18 acetylase RimI-like enzyme
MSKSSASIKKTTATRIKTRTIQAEDVPQIIAIQESIRQKKVSRKWVQMVEGHLQQHDRFGYVALKGDQIVGFITGEVKGEGFGLEQSGWISWIGVHPREMGTGIGQVLAEKLFDSFRRKGIRDIYTSVRWDSADMLSFFKSIGFDRSTFINLIKHLA